MKRIVTAGMVVTVFILVSGCLTTLHPLFTLNDLVTEPRLEGTWKTGSDQDMVIFEKGSAASFQALPESLQKVATKGYLVTFKDQQNNTTIKHYCFLLRLGNELFLDYFPAENENQQRYNSFYKQHYVRMHSFYRIRFRNDKSFELAKFDQDYLKKMIDEKKVRIRYEIHSSGDYIITAPTSELQQYVLKYQNIPEAYESESLSLFNKQ